MNTNANGHDRYRDANQNRMPNNPLLYAQRPQQQQQPQPPPPQRPMAIGEMMERARLAAMNNNNNMNTSRSQSPGAPSTGMSSQFMGAIQRSDQIPIADAHQQQQLQQQQNRTNAPSSSPMDTIVSPPSVSHHSGQTRQNRPSKHYPRPPCLNTWQGRGPGHDEFAGMMSDREKQWVVKIQLHQVAQTKDEVILRL